MNQKLANSWVEIPDGSEFTVSNLPYGCFSLGSAKRYLGVAIGEYVLDLSALAEQGLIPNDDGAMTQATLNGLFERGIQGWSDLHGRLIELLTDVKFESKVMDALISISSVTMHLPFEVGDYVDFYSFRHHAENLGKILRPNSEPLTANWPYVPIGYHGRSGTVAVSGTSVKRPSGQWKGSSEVGPSFGPSQKLDIEAEVGFVVGKGSDLGSPLKPNQFEEHVFGVVLVNDWSARDIQAWEYVPLGPFLGKSFLTSVSPWVVTLEALKGARTSGPVQNPKPLDYLIDDDPWTLQIDLEIALNGQVISRPPFKEMYWTPGQQLAHMTSNGASIRSGDLFASGTISGPHREQWGSLMELTWNGAESIDINGQKREGFLVDGDTVTISASAPSKDGGRIGFGSVSGTIIPG